MKHFNFWQKWLLFVSLYLVLFGLVMAFFEQSSLMDFVFNNQIDPVFWPEGNVPENADTFQAWIYGELGATVTGWGIFMAFLAQYPFKAREKWAWNCFAVGILVWYIADTTEFARLSGRKAEGSLDHEEIESALEIDREEFKLVDHESTRPLAPADWWALPDSSQHRIQISF